MLPIDNGLPVGVVLALRCWIDIWEGDRFVGDDDTRSRKVGDGMFISIWDEGDDDNDWDFLKGWTNVTLGRVAVEIGDPDGKSESRC